MQVKRTPYWLMAVCIAAVAFVSVQSLAQSQESTQTAFQVLIDGSLAGTASSVTNLPSDTVVMRQDSSTSLPRSQVEASEQGTVALTSEDPALISAIEAWMKVDNSGSKNTVQRKTVEIERHTATGTMTRYRLSDAWPVSIDSTNAARLVTIVYQRLEIIH